MTSLQDPHSSFRVLRVSLTDRCNLRCRYCMPAEGLSFAPQDELPSLAELAHAVRFAVRHLGVRRVKLTGGEPLVRQGVVGFVRLVAGIAGVEEVSMTTNGIRLSRWAHKLKDAGLSRVNVSLDTLHPGRFWELTRGGNVASVLSGIRAATQAGLCPLKLNTVLRASSWREDLPDLLLFATRHKFELRFIELMRTGTAREWCEKEFVSAGSIQSFLETCGELIPESTPPASPARRLRYRWAGWEVLLGFITPVSHSFCSSCNRLRLDAKGRLRRCLMDADTLPLVTWLQKGEPAALQAVTSYLQGKMPPSAMVSTVPMVAMGG